MNMEGLLNAFANMLTRVKKEEEKIVPKKIEKDRFTVAEKIISIRQNILEKKIDIDVMTGHQTNKSLICYQFGFNNCTSSKVCAT